MFQMHLFLLTIIVIEVSILQHFQLIAAAITLLFVEENIYTIQFSLIKTHWVQPSNIWVFLV
jgi:hypothetical protein